MHLPFLQPILVLTLSSLHLALAQTTVTITAPMPAATSVPDYTDDASFQSDLLSGHNFYRTEHNATALTWNDTSAAYAADWAAKCGFHHSGGPTGENLAAGYPNATATVDAWGEERSQYDFSSGQFGEDTGHFTQLVWKGTTTVGCGRAACDGTDNTPGEYVVCEYYPPGNVIGDFTENVQSQVSGPTNGDIEEGLNGAGSSLAVEWKYMVTMLAVAGAWAMVI